MNPTNPAVARRLTFARSQLILSHGFFGMLALRMRLVEDPSVKTLQVDGRTITYNPNFIEGLSDSLVRSALAHEVMHPALDHLSRLNHREPKRWNAACDYAINQILVESGFELGNGWLLDSAYRDLSADEIYTRLPEDLKDKSFDEMVPAPRETAASDAIDWKVATIQAVRQAEKAGRLAGGLKRFVEEAVTTKVNWREQLNRFMTQIGKNDYSWSRPNRRYLSAGLFMPGLYSEEMGDVVVAIDTSGSITNEILQTFGAEIKALTAATRPTRIHVVYCDTEINHVDEFSPNDVLTFHPHGGGGTEFKPVFDYVEKQQLKPECLVYLTDLYGRHDFAPPNYPTLWVCTSTLKATFGETIHIQI